jgi:hypothetical protein
MQGLQTMTKGWEQDWVDFQCLPNKFRNFTIHRSLLLRTLNLMSVFTKTVLVFPAVWRVAVFMISDNKAYNAVIKQLDGGFSRIDFVWVGIITLGRKLYSILTVAMRRIVWQKETTMGSHFNVRGCRTVSVLKVSSVVVPFHISLKYYSIWGLHHVFDIGYCSFCKEKDDKILTLPLILFHLWWSSFVLYM